jgi:hypothetical protein
MNASATAPAGGPGGIDLSLRFWFYGSAIITGIATACFTVATVLSA